MGFCKKLSGQTGMKIALPTEAQWEYSCRAGTNTAYSFGDSERQLGEYAWYYSNTKALTSGLSTYPVGQKKPNPWGLYDMHGNVFEECHSLHKPYPYNAKDGREDIRDSDFRPTGGARRAGEEDRSRVYRGGGWGSDPKPDGPHRSTIEETAVAVEALLADPDAPLRRPALEAGLTRLVAAVSEGRHRETAPIGFYFARLWYYEKLYPLIFTVSALGQAVGRLCPGSSDQPARANHGNPDSAGDTDNGAKLLDFTGRTNCAASVTS